MNVNSMMYKAAAAKNIGREKIKQEWQDLYERVNGMTIAECMPKLVSLIKRSLKYSPNYKTMKEADRVLFDEIASLVAQHVPEMCGSKVMWIIQNIMKWLAIIALYIRGINSWNSWIIRIRSI